MSALLRFGTGGSPTTSSSPRRRGCEQRQRKRLPRGCTLRFSGPLGRGSQDKEPHDTCPQLCVGVNLDLCSGGSLWGRRSPPMGPCGGSGWAGGPTRARSALTTGLGQNFVCSAAVLWVGQTRHSGFLIGLFKITIFNGAGGPTRKADPLTHFSASTSVALGTFTGLCRRPPVSRTFSSSTLKRYPPRTSRPGARPPTLRLCVGLTATVSAVTQNVSCDGRTSRSIVSSGPVHVASCVTIPPSAGTPSAYPSTG